ncbi:DUF4920 domain-containing protein [Arsukibacterium sp.]|uniref:DUF4920 domain-containing protein n=1 Tax=Arsukibacterium sp. TaxID=1977258 RepID=UPI002FD8BD2F
MQKFTALLAKLLDKKAIRTGVLLSAFVATGLVQAEPLQFGEVFDTTSLTSVSAIMAKPEHYLEQTLTIAGEVTAVCSKQHCWMTLATAESEPKFRIKVRDGDMVFPISAKGKTAYAHGALKLWPQGEGKADGYQLVPSAVTIAE